MDILDIILGSEMANEYTDKTGKRVIDLSKFNCKADGVTKLLNVVVMELFGANMMTGGGTQKVEVQDIDGKLRKACADAHNFKVRMWTDASEAIDMPVVYVFDNDTALQFGASFVMWFGGIYFETAMNLMFYNDSDQVDIFNKVTVLSA